MSNGRVLIIAKQNLRNIGALFVAPDKQRFPLGIFYSNGT